MMLEIDKKWIIWGLCALLAACAAPLKPPVTVTPPPPQAAVPPPVVSPAIAPPVQPFAVSKWEMLPDWQTMNLTPSWPAFLQSCRMLKAKPGWQAACTRGEQLGADDSSVLRAFYEEWFTPYQVFNPDGSEQGMITGYYEPLLKGSRSRTSRFRYPLYAAPDDLLQIDMGEAYPQLKDLRLRGRLQGKRVVPYYSRAEIDAGAGSLKGRELFWVEDAVELFFLQVQGSGRIELPDGKLVKIGYAEQNGYPYVSIGKKLVEAGELKLEEASMQGIKAWAGQHPDKLGALLAKNPSYVFFRELPDGLTAPLGALGVPLTNEYSLAVDARTIPLGAPVFLATTHPNDNTPLNRLMLAQDTGGAIKGAVRADFFWGFGNQAAMQAGKMKQQGRMWVLFPKGSEPVLN
ncbi:MAG: MltA domain-containing protein [Gallionellaceae bacterium]|nr:MltA domain-containing protein [Gallionellaceae bacterium]